MGRRSANSPVGGPTRQLATWVASRPLQEPPTHQLTGHIGSGAPARVVLLHPGQLRLSRATTPARRRAAARDARAPHLSVRGGADGGGLPFEDGSKRRGPPRRGPRKGPQHVRVGQDQGRADHRRRRGGGGGTAGGRGRRRQRPTRRRSRRRRAPTRRVARPTRPPTRPVSRPRATRRRPRPTRLARTPRRRHRRHRRRPPGPTARPTSARSVPSRRPTPARRSGRRLARRLAGRSARRSVRRRGRKLARTPARRRTPTRSTPEVRRHPLRDRRPLRRGLPRARAGQQHRQPGPDLPRSRRSASRSSVPPQMHEGPGDRGLRHWCARGELNPHVLSDTRT